MMDIILVEEVEKRLKHAIYLETLLKEHTNPLENLVPDEVKAQYCFSQ